MRGAEQALVHTAGHDDVGVAALGCDEAQQLDAVDVAHVQVEEHESRLEGAERRLEELGVQHRVHLVTHALACPFEHAENPAIVVDRDDAGT